MHHLRGEYRGGRAMSKNGRVGDKTLTGEENSGLGGGTSLSKRPPTSSSPCEVRKRKGARNSMGGGGLVKTLVKKGGESLKTGDCRKTQRGET